MNTGDHRHSINGVDGRMFARSPRDKSRGTWRHQRWGASRNIAPTETMSVELRFDDDCGNGHNTFSITADMYESSRHVRHRFARGGCLHDEIAQHFPELTHLSRWHLVSTDGPTHYLANTLYFAGDADCSGRRKGEPSAWSQCVRFGGNPIRHPLKDSFAAFLRGHAPQFDLEVLPFDHPERGRPGKHQFAPKYTLGGYGAKWHECPFDTEDEALRFLAALQSHAPMFERVPTAYSEGKKRELDLARAAAVWPEATDEQLSAPRAELEAVLLARLPDLLADFRRDVEACGFAWSSADAPA